MTNALLLDETETRRILPPSRKSLTHKFWINGTEGYLTIGLFDDGSPGEIFMKVSKEGTVVSGLIQGFCRAFSLSLQHGLELSDADLDARSSHTLRTF